MVQVGLELRVCRSQGGHHDHWANEAVVRKRERGKEQVESNVKVSGHYHPCVTCLCLCMLCLCQSMLCLYLAMLCLHLAMLCLYLAVHASDRDEHRLQRNRKCDYPLTIVFQLFHL